MLPVYIHAMFAPFGILVKTATAFKIIPAVVGILTLIEVYFATKSLYNNEVTMLSSLLIAISSGHGELLQERQLSPVLVPHSATQDKSGCRIRG
jgi:hypothetical protein